MNSPFRVLYRQFLFRAIDLELISTGGDMTALLGQFAALLIWFSAMLGFATLTGAGAVSAEKSNWTAIWTGEHFLISTTMLIVGLFAVLSWESIFPDRRDVLVLAHLPVNTRTLFFAKVAATGAALGVTIGAFNMVIGVIWPLVRTPAGDGILDLLFSLAFYRLLFAYWFTMISAGAFVYGSILTVQGVASQILPRRMFLRVSAALQVAAFCLLVWAYFTEPSIASPQGLAAAENQRALAWLPTYWFLGLFEKLNGSAFAAMGPLTARAWIGVAIAICGTAVAYSLSYFRTLRRVIEEPDILPGSQSSKWLPRFGNAYQTAIVQFSIRTLLRSRQHRMIFSFYLGVGFAIMIMFGNAPASRQELMAAAAYWPQVTIAPLASSVVMMCVWITGIRVVFSMPIDFRANWIFRIAPLPDASACLAARRRAFVILAIAPVWVASAAAILWFWPLAPALLHLSLLALLGLALTEICLMGTQKIPFTCSYLPGKSRIHIVMLAAFGIGFIILDCVQYERQVMGDPAHYVRIPGEGERDSGVNAKTIPG